MVLIFVRRTVVFTVRSDQNILIIVVIDSQRMSIRTKINPNFFTCSRSVNALCDQLYVANCKAVGCLVRIRTLIFFRVLMG